jgi:hypothetical protein
VLERLFQSVKAAPEITMSRSGTMYERPSIDLAFNAGYQPRDEQVYIMYYM